MQKITKISLTLLASLVLSACSSNSGGSDNHEFIKRYTK